MPIVTIDRIDALGRHIADAVIQTTPQSTLPPQQQDMILAQACRESCDLLSDWLEGPPPEPWGEADDVPVREFLRDQQQFAEFLSPLFADVLKRARNGRRDVGAVSAAESDALVATARRDVARAVRGASATARRYPRMTTRHIFQVTTDHVGQLKAQVCDLASQLGEAKEADARRVAQSAARRRRARKTLKIVGNILVGLSVSLAAPAIGPQVSHEVSMLAHGVQIVIAHDLAAQAQPGIAIAPPHAGPQLR